MSKLAPELRQINVAPEKLIPDPNNPRLISRDDDKRDEAEALDLLDATIGRMRSDQFKVDEIENSIKQNGWVAIDSIFVKKLDNDGRYLVLEGNRRVTALRNLRNDDKTAAELKESLSSIEVMEIIDDISEEELRKKITYLLGVRHHGSLKKWSPFAQAHNIYLRYLELAGVEKEEFKWDKDQGQEIADALSIDIKELLERLKIYRAMEQIGNTETVINGENNTGGMKGRYYSVIGEVLLTNNKPLKSYINQNTSTFLLDSESLERIINLCHFDKSSRDGSPINTPNEWRDLGKILGDNDEDKRKEMLRLVEEEKIKPSIVWADRSVELQKLQWDKWLGKVNAILSRVNLGDDLSSNDALKVTTRLVSLLDDLDQIDDKAEI